MLGLCQETNSFKWTLSVQIFSQHYAKRIWSRSNFPREISLNISGGVCILLTTNVNINFSWTSWSRGTFKITVAVIFMPFGVFSCSCRRPILWSTCPNTRWWSTWWVTSRPRGQSPPASPYASPSSELCERSASMHRAFRVSVRLELVRPCTHGHLHKAYISIMTADMSIHC